MIVMLQGMSAFVECLISLLVVGLMSKTYTVFKNDKTHSFSACYHHGAPKMYSKKMPLCAQYV